MPRLVVAGVVALCLVAGAPAAAAEDAEGPGVEACAALRAHQRSFGHFAHAEGVEKALQKNLAGQEEDPKAWSMSLLVPPSFSGSGLARPARSMLPGCGVKQACTLTVSAMDVTPEKLAKFLKECPQGLVIVEGTENANLEALRAVRAAIQPNGQVKGVDSTKAAFMLATSLHLAPPIRKWLSNPGNAMDGITNYVTSMVGMSEGAEVKEVYKQTAESVFASLDYVGAIKAELWEKGDQPEPPKNMDRMREEYEKSESKKTTKKKKKTNKSEL